MSPQKTFLALLAAASILAAGTANAALAGGKSARAKAKRAIEGTWRVEATADPNPPDAPPAPSPFFGVLTFAQGGAVFEANTAYTPGTATSGVGSWEHQSGRTFRYTYFKIIFSPEGQLVGVLKVVGTFEVSEDGEAFNQSRYRVEMMDPTGTETIFRGAGDLTSGRRLSVEASE